MKGGRARSDSTGWMGDGDLSLINAALHPERGCAYLIRVVNRLHGVSRPNVPQASALVVGAGENERVRGRVGERHSVHVRLVAEGFDALVLHHVRYSRRLVRGRRHEQSIVGRPSHLENEKECDNNEMMKLRQTQNCYGNRANAAIAQGK